MLRIGALAIITEYHSSLFATSCEYGDSLIFIHFFHFRQRTVTIFSATFLQADRNGKGHVGMHDQKATREHYGRWEQTAGVQLGVGANGWEQHIQRGYCCTNIVDGERQLRCFGHVPGREFDHRTWPHTSGARYLQWTTFSDAANQAGISLRYGGIHFKAGDLVGRAVGSLVGAQTFVKAQGYFSGNR